MKRFAGLSQKFALARRSDMNVVTPRRTPSYEFMAKSLLKKTESAGTALFVRARTQVGSSARRLVSVDTGNSQLYA